MIMYDHWPTLFLFDNHLPILFHTGQPLITRSKCHRLHYFLHNSRLYMISDVQVLRSSVFNPLTRVTSVSIIIASSVQDL